MPDDSMTDPRVETPVDQFQDAIHARHTPVHAMDDVVARVKQVAGSGSSGQRTCNKHRHSHTDTLTWAQRGADVSADDRSVDA